MTVNKYMDVIDSREVIERLEELREELASDLDPASRDEYRAELSTLEALAVQGENSADWQYGETLVRDSYFTDYAKELAEDIGATQRDQSWPYTHIDWEAAAQELQQDYTDIDFDGVTYWIR